MHTLPFSAAFLQQAHSHFRLSAFGSQQGFFSSAAQAGAAIMETVNTNTDSNLIIFIHFFGYVRLFSVPNTTQYWELSPDSRQTEFWTG